MGRYLREVLAFAYLVSPLAYAEQLVNRHVPEEYETVGGHALGFANAGVAAADGLAAVRMNPAIMSLKKTYDVAGGYNWPTAGREFYHAGVVDSKSANVAAGFLYSGFVDDYDDISSDERDARLDRRATLGLGGVVKNLSIGINGSFIEAGSYEEDGKEVKGTTLGFGVAGLVTPQLRFGASVENLANKKVRDYAPRIVRAGLAAMFFNGRVTAHLDYRHRERVAQFEQGVADGPIATEFSAAQKETIEDDNNAYEKPEQMAIASASVRVYDLIRILAGYGHTVDGPERRTIAGGLAIVSGNTSLSFAASRPYMESEEAHQAVNAAIAITL